MMQNGNGKPYQQRIDELQKVLDVTRAELAAAKVENKKLLDTIYQLNIKLKNSVLITLSAVGADAETYTKGGA